MYCTKLPVLWISDFLWIEYFKPVDSLLGVQGVHFKLGSNAFCFDFSIFWQILERYFWKFIWSIVINYVVLSFYRHCMSAVHTIRFHFTVKDFPYLYIDSGVLKICLIFCCTCNSQWRKYSGFLSSSFCQEQNRVIPR